MDALTRILEILGKPWVVLSGAALGIFVGLYLFLNHEWASDFRQADTPIILAGLFVCAMSGAIAVRTLSFILNIFFRVLIRLVRSLDSITKPARTRRTLRQLDQETREYLWRMLTQQNERQFRSKPEGHQEHLQDQLEDKNLIENTQHFIFPSPPPKLTKDAWNEIRKDPRIIGMTWAKGRNNGYYGTPFLAPNLEGAKGLLQTLGVKDPIVMNDQGEYL